VVILAQFSSLTGRLFLVTFLADGPEVFDRTKQPFNKRIPIESGRSILRAWSRPDWLYMIDGNVLSSEWLETDVAFKKDVGPLFLSALNRRPIDFNPLSLKYKLQVRM
jgi:hypothetical protein